MFSLPIPRTNWPAKCNSSSVQCGLTKAPMEAAPWLLLICLRPLATYSKAVCQSTSTHLPPCLIMGEVSRSGEFSAS